MQVSESSEETLREGSGRRQKENSLERWPLFILDPLLFYSAHFSFLV